MKKHNGHIYFETEEGKGTTFFVLLPIGEAGGTMNPSTI
jgi:signal transduction histidine kinase